MFRNALNPDKEGKPASNQLIVERLAEEVSDEKLKDEIEKEIVRKGVGQKVSYSDLPAPPRPAPGALGVKGVHSYADNRTTFEDFQSAFYGLGYSPDGINASEAVFNEIAGKKQRAIEALSSRIEAIESALKAYTDDIIVTEMQVRKRQLGSELAALRESRVPQQKSVAGFIVDNAERLADNGAGKVQIRGAHISVRRAQSVIVDWGFTLIDVANYEGEL